MPPRPKRFKPSDPEFHRADWPFYWIAMVNTLYTQKMERALRSVDCDLPTYRVLAILQEQGTSSVSDIALHSVAKLSTTTKIVYRMKADGLVLTSTSETDGRVTLVAMTDAGRTALGRVRDATFGLFERSFDGLTPAKLEKLNESLRLVFRNLNGGDHPTLGDFDAEGA
ncbi:MAG: MarR family transcriptional regulator [Xylophilus ampelinus]